MRKQNTDHWKKDENLEGLLFFSQLLDEMLFDYTLDSYKPLALNSRSLCYECLITIEEVKSGFMTERNLKPVIEELVWSLNSDLAAKKILGAKFDYYVQEITSNDNKLEKLSTIVSFIKLSFSDKKYLNEIKTQLVELIKEGKRKEKITSLTKSLITELIENGYNPNHIYYQSNNFFYNPKKKDKIETAEEINTFLGLFDFKPKEFTCVFIGGILFREFKGTLNRFDIVVTKTYNCFSKIAEDIAFQESRKSDESFIICSKVLSLDHHSAKEKAEDLIGQITGLFNFYHHKQKPIVLDKAVISRNKDKYVLILDRPTKSILKIKSDQSPKDAAISVQETFGQMKMDVESMQRILRFLDLHSSALISVTTQNQLLNLWAALETLMPKSYESNQDRIVQICAGLIPFLQINYVQKQISEVLNDLELWNTTFFKNILERVPNSDKNTDLEKTAALVCIPSNVKLRKELYNALIDYPLLVNRIYHLHMSMNSPAKIKKLLETHGKKIGWHLRRIYRIRGLIIHSGKYPSYTITLIENLHSYLDIFVRKILNLSAEEKIRNIEQAILEVQISSAYQIKLLAKYESEELNEANFKEVLLGIDEK